MKPGIANADLISRLLIDALRRWVNICTRYASRSFSVCYVLWRAVLHRFARKFRMRMQNHTSVPPRTTATGRGFAASSLPSSLGNSHDDVPIPLQSKRTTEGETNTTPTSAPVRSCLRNSSTSSDQLQRTARTSIILSDEQLVASPVQERTVTFDESYDGYEAASPTDFRSESPELTAISLDAKRWSLVPFVPDSSERYDRQIDM